MKRLLNQKQTSGGFSIECLAKGLSYFRRFAKWIVAMDFCVTSAIALCCISQSLPYYYAINSGHLAYDRNDLKTAEAYFMKALKETDAYSGTDVRRARALNNLARIYQAQGKLVESEPLLLETIAICGKTMGEREEYPVSISNLACLYRQQKRFLESESQFQRSLVTWGEKIKTKKNLKYVSILASQARLFRDEQKYEKAEEICLEAVHWQKSCLGNSDFAVADLLGSLGLIYRDWARFAESENCLTRALNADRKHYDESSDYVLADLNNLASLYKARGDRDAARQTFSIVLQSSSGSSCTNNTIIRTAKNNLTELLSSL